MTDYELCKTCLSITPLTDSISIFDNHENSTVSWIGKCGLCGSTVKGIEYPLTKDVLQVS